MQAAMAQVMTAANMQTRMLVPTIRRVVPAPGLADGKEQDQGSGVRDQRGDQVVRRQKSVFSSYAARFPEVIGALGSVPPPSVSPPSVAGRDIRGPASELKGRGHAQPFLRLIQSSRKDVIWGPRRMRVR